MTLYKTRWWGALGAALLLSAAGCTDSEGDVPTFTPPLSTQPPVVDPTPTAQSTPTAEQDATATAEGATPTVEIVETPTSGVNATPTQATTHTPEATESNPASATPTALPLTPTPIPVRIDNDGDGFTVEDGDCDDTRADVSPADPEVPYDGVDNDCADGDLTDVDGDGADGGPSGDDCDDLDEDRSPYFDEIPYDDIDNNCDGADLSDVDGDGRDAILAGGNDCDDDDDTIYPGATEIPYDDIDQDCSGADLTDVDGDSFDGEEAGGDDCDDQNVNTYPGAAEFDDGTDNDCDGEIDEASATSDADGDGYSPSTGDCNDGDAEINPGAEELPYDGIDQDCSGSDLFDVDGDGYAGGDEGPDCDDLDENVNPGSEEIPYNDIDEDCLGGDLVDVDNDGYAATEIGGDDCNDDDGAINPGAIELCDGEDENCNGVADDSPADGITYYSDGDADGFGALDQPVDACELSEGLASNSNDCDDDDSAVNPEASEVCNGIDDDCDLQIDDGLTSDYYQDLDSDGFGNPEQGVTVCEVPSGYVSDNTDCKDNNDLVYPGATEYCNGVDDNCDGVIDDGVSTTYYADADGDLFGDPTQSQQACSAVSGYVLNGDDCDDSSDAISPESEELCDSLDNDCDSTVDEGVIETYHQDLDEDGYGNPSKALDSCSQPDGYVLDNTDCKDTNDNIHPGATEYCNGVDDDCDGQLDDDATQTYYADEDSDGFGAEDSAVDACVAPSGYVLNGDDCDDSNSSVSPVGQELCNGLDDDCNGDIDEGVKSTFYADTDGDGYGDAEAPNLACELESGYVIDATDCNDEAASAYPGASELCNLIDDDCDESVDEGVKSTFYSDGDDDGYGNPNLSVQACEAADGYVEAGTDCNDSVASINPGATELCNSLDDNCNSTIDDLDADEDGHRPIACGGDDCDDSVGTTHPGAEDVCDDGVDNDCSGRENFCYDSASFDQAQFN